MRYPHLKITIRHLMGAVAFVALMIPIPGEALLSLAQLFLAVWFPFLCVVTMISEFLRARWVVACLVLVSTGGLALTMGHETFHHEFIPLEVVIFGVTPLNLMGPFLVARRLRQRRRPAAGELLWAWLGLVWSVLLSSWFPHGARDVLDLMGQFARMSLILCVLLAQYGHRPAPQESRWAHYTGWALMECNILIWGWYATGFLK
jgi:hypothetical protein